MVDLPAHKKLPADVWPYFQYILELVFSVVWLKQTFKNNWKNILQIK